MQFLFNKFIFLKKLTFYNTVNHLQLQIIHPMQPELFSTYHIFYLLLKLFVRIQTNKVRYNLNCIQHIFYSTVSNSGPAKSTQLSLFTLVKCSQQICKKNKTFVQQIRQTLFFSYLYRLTHNFHQLIPYDINCYLK